MTLEIYDYLWIRNVLIALDSKTLNENIQNKEEYTFIIKTLSGLMQHEDFPLVFPESQEKISDLVQYYRFEYNNKDIIDDINYIIERLNQYKTMSDSRKKYLIDEFYKEEREKRKLPFIYGKSIDVINCLIQNDIHTYRDIFECYVTGETKKVQLSVFDIIGYNSLTNLLKNKYPEFFENEEIRNNTIHNLGQLIFIKNIPLDIRNNIKATIKNLEPKKQKRLFK